MTESHKHNMGEQVTEFLENVSAFIKSENMQNNTVCAVYI